MYFLDKAGRTRIISSVDTVGTGTQGSSLLVIDFIQQISIYLPLESQDKNVLYWVFAPIMGIYNITANELL